MGDPLTLEAHLSSLCRLGALGFTFPLWLLSGSAPVGLHQHVASELILDTEEARDISGREAFRLQEADLRALVAAEPAEIYPLEAIHHRFVRLLLRLGSHSRVRRLIGLRRGRITSHSNLRSLFVVDDVKDRKSDASGWLTKC